jgi:hypothetical protein
MHSIEKIGLFWINHKKCDFGIPRVGLENDPYVVF